MISWNRQKKASIKEWAIGYLGEEDPKNPFDKGCVRYQLPIKEGKDISQVLVVIGMTGSGKTSTATNVAFGISQRRPVIWLDPVGRDHYINYLPSTAENLPPSTQPRGLYGLYFYYPVKNARPKAPWEQEVHPNLTKYNVNQLMRLGLQFNSAKKIRQIFDKYGPFDSFDAFTQFVTYFPTKPEEFRGATQRFGKELPFHGVFYEEGDVINKDTKAALLRDFDLLLEEMGRDFFRLDDDLDLDYIELLKQEKNLVFSYMRKQSKKAEGTEIDFSKAEIDYFLEKAEYVADHAPKVKKPFICVEEAHEVFDERISYFITVCRKLNIGLMMVMPIVPEKMPLIVFEQVRHFISGVAVGHTIKALETISRGSEHVEKIRLMKFDELSSERFMAYYNGYGDRLLWNIKMYQPPCEIHRETGLIQGEQKKRFSFGEDEDRPALALTE